MCDGCHDSTTCDDNYAPEFDCKWSAVRDECVDLAEFSSSCATTLPIESRIDARFDQSGYPFAMTCVSSLPNNLRLSSSLTS